MPFYTSPDSRVRDNLCIIKPCVITCPAYQLFLVYSCVVDFLFACSTIVDKYANTFGTILSQKFNAQADKSMHADFVVVCCNVFCNMVSSAGDSLKVIGTYSVGNDHINVSECKRRKVYVATTPDVASDSAAELTVALILVTTRRIAEGRDQL